MIARRRSASVGRAARASVALFKADAASGILLMAAAVAAVAWANLAPDGYETLWRTRLRIGVEPLALAKSLRLWINDGLMAIFFLLVALEIKREAIQGELASGRRAVLPLVAAAGGMVAPAAIYALLNLGGTGGRGWGIPMATDIAFALGLLALLGRRVPASLRVFLTAVAVADDLGAVAVIAIFYSGDLSGAALALGALVLVALTVVNRAAIHSVWPYALLGAMLWVAVLRSGVHATIAGVLLAFTIPASLGSARGRPRRAVRPLLERIEHALQPWVSYVIMPIFALANAGVPLSATALTGLDDPIAIGIILGLFLGKQLGVAGSCWALVRLGLAAMPSRATWGQLYGVALLCGIGFTMSLFIATLAFPSPEALEPAKLGILVGSLASGIAGYVVLRRGRGSPPAG